MRRSLSSICSALGLVGVSAAAGGTMLLAGGGVAASADPGGAGGGQAAAPGKPVCTIKDQRLRELSGMVATKSGYVVINDGTDIAGQKQVFFLDAKCQLSKAVQYSGNGPLDTEDLAVSADGKTLWIADTGDNVTNAQRRSKVALWSMPVDGSKKPVLHRLSYPGGQPRDAEALLMSDDGTPIIVTKSTGKAEIFTPAGALKTNNADPVPMKKVGEVTLPKSTTENPLQAAGRVAVTGAARSPDGSRIVLRTYADAFEWDVSGGDMVKALTTGQPRMTPLADPFGEAIAYTPDGARYVTVSDAGTLGDGVEVSILSYQPVTVVPPSNVRAEAPKTASAKSWSDSLTLQDITYLIAAVGVLGAVLVGAGIFGIVRSRRKRADDDADAPDGNGGGNRPRIGRQVRPEGPADPHLASVSGGSNRGVYGVDLPDDQETSGRARPPSGGAVYGGQSSGGAVYGGGKSSGPAGDGGVYGGGPSGGGYGGDSSGGVYGGGGYPDRDGRRDRDHAGDRGVRDGYEQRSAMPDWPTPGGYRGHDVH